MVTALDEAVGNITKSLREAAMEDNTLIIFTTDNGGPPSGFNMNWANNWPLRGGKTSDSFWAAHDPCLSNHLQHRHFPLCLVT